jgi:hypothetical protein
VIFFPVKFFLQFFSDQRGENPVDAHAAPVLLDILDFPILETVGRAFEGFLPRREAGRNLRTFKPPLGIPHTECGRERTDCIPFCVPP